MRREKAREYLEMVAQDFAMNGKGQDDGVGGNNKRTITRSGVAEDAKPIGKNWDGTDCYDPDCGDLAYKFSDDKEDRIGSEGYHGEMDLHGARINDTIEKAKAISKEIENGRWIHQRVPEEALRGVIAGSRRLAEASYVCGRNASPSGQTPSGVPGEKDRIAAVEREFGKKQELDLEAYAKAEGIWSDDLDWKLNEQFGESREGGETIVFFDEKKQLAHKLITNTYYRQPVEVLDRIALHNWLFPSAAMKVVGFGKTASDWKGDVDNPMFVTEVEQPFIKIARGATDGEIQEYMNGIGFEEWKNGWWRSKDGNVLVSDLHDENAVIDDHGNFQVIDADVRLNTPSLGMGGSYRVGE